MTNTKISLEQNDPTTEMTLKYQFHKTKKSLKLKVHSN